MCFSPWAARHGLPMGRPPWAAHRPIVRTHVTTHDGGHVPMVGSPSWALTYLPHHGLPMTCLGHLLAPAHHPERALPIGSPKATHDGLSRTDAPGNSNGCQWDVRRGHPRTSPARAAHTPAMLGTHATSWTWTAKCIGDERSNPHSTAGGRNVHRGSPSRCGSCHPQIENSARKAYRAGASSARRRPGRCRL
ncbi:unnamed protein product, partial [Ectocarpus sp. 4 AP-2014]